MQGRILHVPRNWMLVRQEMDKEEVDLHFITTLDDIAWLFNLRGYDIEYNPVFLSFALIGKTNAVLFIDLRKITPDVKEHLEKDDITILEYAEIDKYLKDLDDLVLVNPEDCNAHLFRQIREESIVEGTTITRMLKACKTSSEVKHIDEAMIKDGIALAGAFHEMIQRISSRTFTEADFARLIAHYRSLQKDYYGESFPAIVGYQANGAIVHYRPPDQGSAVLLPEGLLLCDSGGQYYDGTTDITRTMALGPVTEEQKDSYTRVLKGHIAIDQAIFPRGTTGGSLDILARQYLWKSGLNFGHGTGHGVGYFLNVHEPPQGISPGSGSRSTTAFLPGMLTSNEPGYYKDGEAMVSELKI